MKPYVDLNMIDNDGKPKTFAKFYLEGSKISVKYPIKPVNLNDILFDGEFINGEGGKKFSIKTDGMEFMKNLQWMFSGSRVRATDVMFME